MAQYNERILLVDDNDGMLCTLGDILEQEGYIVNTFGQGSHALKWMKENEFAVVVVDIKLADMNGMDLLAQIRLLNPEASVIMMTGCASAETAVEAMHKGAYSYIIKPFDAAELIALIKKALKEIRLTRNNRELINQLQLYNRNLEKYKKSLEERTRELELAIEQARLMAEEAEAANKAKSAFLANMSHEIRTPMNAIIGFAQLMSEEDLPVDQREYINMISSAGENLLSLINDILDFSKIEAGRLEISLTDYSLDELCGYMLSLMGPTAGRKGIDFAVIKEENLPAVIQIDPVRVRQCLTNLIGNAIKFTHNGHVHLRVSIESHDEESFIRFDVEDTGIGISEEKCEQIFEAFSQADGSTTRKFGGTGLGLTISKRLAHLMGGSISVKSRPEVGSAFTLMIPAKSGEVCEEETRLQEQSAY